MKLIGLIPAAGHATRLGPALVGSKELIPLAASHACTPRPVCELLLEQMRDAGVEHVVMVIRDGKWDIPAYFKNGDRIGLAISYVVTGPTTGVPQTLDRAYTQLRDAVVVMGFPDILVAEAGCLAQLVRAYRANPVDVLLGLFPLTDGAMDAVELSGRRVHRVTPKPGSTAYAKTWGYAVWRQRFTDFLHARLATPIHIGDKELYIGDMMQHALAHGLTVDGIALSTRPFIDIGTPAGLRAAGGLLTPA